MSDRKRAYALAKVSNIRETRPLGIVASRSIRRGIGLDFNLFSEPVSGIAAGVRLGFSWQQSSSAACRFHAHACIAEVVTSIGFEVASFRSDQVATPQLLKPFGQIEASGRILQIKDLIGRPRVSLDLLQ